MRNEDTMEVSVGDYGRMMFEMLVAEKGNLPEHWQSIQVLAEPLVRQLIALNGQMTNGGYEIHGYVEPGNKKILSKHELIQAAQEKALKFPANKLKIGDRLWLIEDGELDMSFDQDPVAVSDIGNTGSIYVEMQGGYVAQIHPSNLVLKAPDDWDENEDQYRSDDYWLNAK